MKLSLIFCCYNVSKYLDGIYYLLKSQPYKNIEVIFVEDCSTDNTKEKLKSFLVDPRIQLIENKINLGASESRNVGLRVATGDYVGFPDSDDLFDLNWFVKVSEVIRMYEPTVIVCGMREDYEKEGKIEYSINITSKYSGNIDITNIEVLLDLENTMLFGYMNNKFYKRSILIENNIFSKTMPLKEDFEFNIQVFHKIDSYYILNYPYYFYKKRINSNSLSSKYVPEYFDIHQKSVFLFKDLLEKNGELTKSAQELLINRFYRYFISAVERNIGKHSGISWTEQNEWARNILNNPKYAFFLERKNLIRGKIQFIRCILTPNKVPLLIMLGYFIKTVKTYSPILFAKIK